MLVRREQTASVSYSLYGQDDTLLLNRKNGYDTYFSYPGQKLIAQLDDPNAPQQTNTRRHNLPYGESIEAPSNTIGYTSHKYDTDTGLVYMQQRYMDPAIGRFYSNDPLGFRDVHSLNGYAYANNSPYKFVDPDGRNPIAGALTGCSISGPACPVGALIGGVIGSTITAGVLAVAASNNKAKSETASNSAANGDGANVTVDDDGSGSVIITVDAGGREIEVMSDTPQVEGDRLVLDGENGVHISTSDERGVGLKGMRDAGREIGKHYGVSEVEIRGGERSSGANKGKKPKPVVIKVDK